MVQILQLSHSLQQADGNSFLFDKEIRDIAIFNLIEFETESVFNNLFV